jgi:hypothetical protein
LPHPATKPPPPPGWRLLSCPQERLIPEGLRWAHPAREPRRHRRRSSGTVTISPLREHPVPRQSLRWRRLCFWLLLPAAGGTLLGPHWSAEARTHLEPTQCRPQTPQGPFLPPPARQKEQSPQHARTGAVPMRPTQLSPELTARRTSAPSPCPALCPGAGGASRLMTLVPGKSMYQLVTSSITSLTVMAPAAGEVSTAPAAGERSGTLAADEGSDTSAAGEGSTITATGVGSNIGVITTSRPPDDGGGVESSSKTTTTSPPPEPATVGRSRAA